MHVLIRNLLYPQEIMDDEEAIQRRFELLGPHLDERTRRLAAAAEAEAMGFGGVAKVARATGYSRLTLRRGLKELKATPEPDCEGRRIRRPGGGRKRTVDTDLTLRSDLETLVQPTERGDPESPLRWTCKSVRRLAEELKRMGHQTSHRMVAEMLHAMGYSLQANSKTLEGVSHPDRDDQFEHINRQAQEHFATADPVISVDTKKKELVGDFKNGGRELRPQGQPEKVRVHDFVIPELGRAIPYGVYDLATNSGWVSVGVDHDTSTFAVEAVRRWWRSMGNERYPQAQRLLITADGGGSNGSRVRLWKVELQQLADELGLPITVSHFPPGTSKWNKIEHRLFSFISQNWRGKPLISHEVIVNLIAATTTATGLKVRAELDTAAYPVGRKVSKQEVAEVNLHRDSFHGEWNYTIFPREKSEKASLVS
jgi:DNA-binding phage protein